MAQLFSPEADTRFRRVIAAAILGAGTIGVAALASEHFDWAGGEPYAPDQPIPFQHSQHVAGLGIDCRFCHNTVEKAAFAGMPSAQTCLTCHSQVLAGMEVMEPLRTSAALAQPIHWNRVFSLPDFAYFHHGRHVRAGVACETCHGDVGRMTKVFQAVDMNMGWCLDCHRGVRPQVGPPSPVPERAAASQTPQAVLDAYGVATDYLTNCDTCHR